MGSSLFKKQLEAHFSDTNAQVSYDFDETTVVVTPEMLLESLTALRDETSFQFDTLIDICGVDYGAFGLAEWETIQATDGGFSRGREVNSEASIKPKLAVVYHLLSTKLNHRIRVKVFCDDSHIIPSSHQIWSAANWFEREAYDMFGILFAEHPDLRRILTDYGFIGHPFRKDFPVSGHVEMRYDDASKRCVYGPVEIEPRVLVPKVVRDDNRYADSEGDV